MSLYDDVPLACDLFLKSTFFSTSRSWIPVVDAESLLHRRTIRHVVVEAILASCLLVLNSKLLCRSNSQHPAHLRPSTTSRFDCDTRRCERALMKFPSIGPRILGILLSGQTCPHPS